MEPTEIHNKQKIKVTLRYTGPVYLITGRLNEEIEVGENSSVLNLIREVCRRYGKSLHSYIFGSFDQGFPRHPVQIFYNGEYLKNLKAQILKDGDEIAILFPINGG